MWLIEKYSNTGVVVIFARKQSESDAMEEPDNTARAIVAGIRAGDKASERSLYEQYQRGVYLMLLKRTNDPDRASDLCHDALVIVLLKLREGKITDPDRLSAYIFQTARYVHLGWLRRAASQTDQHHEDIEQLTDHDNPEHQQIRNQQITATRQLISELRVPRDREILTRYYIKDQAKSEICEALQLTSEHFDRVIHRAKNRFRELLEESDLELEVEEL